MPNSYCGWRNRVGSDSIFIFLKIDLPLRKNLIKFHEKS
jgi:hypothetical protein